MGVMAWGNAHPSQGRSTQQRSTSRMKTARKLSSSLRSVGRSISKKFTPSKPQLQQAQVICPVDAYPGKQIAIQTPDGQTLNVIVPRNVMPGMPFNVLYTSNSTTFSTNTIRWAAVLLSFCSFSLDTKFEDNSLQFQNLLNTFAAHFCNFFGPPTVALAVCCLAPHLLS